ncbi:MAG: hypothetical protein GWN00_05185 [Aliifodinibius sp.]|nr:hypothetical protein [Fodinibius sp.]NIV10595.1 hypothetical protein [Fodinibius sp.]NIY24223.1 hypothetical protein [Fodinibius sp.]
MSYNSPLIISTSSLNPSFGVTAAVPVFVPVVVVCAVPALAIIILVHKTWSPILISVALAALIFIVPCAYYFKATYVQPDAHI